MKKIFIVISILVVIFLSACKSQETEKGRKGSSQIDKLQLYENKDLGISIKYPSSFKVYQQNKDEIRIESDYKNPEAPLMSIGMNIKRINPQRETQEVINFRLQGKSIIDIQNKGNYELLEVEGRFNYLLSDKGTFYIGDTVDFYQQTLEQEGLYQKYKTQFNEILNSIKII